MTTGLNLNIQKEVEYFIDATSLIYIRLSNKIPITTRFYNWYTIEKWSNAIAILRAKINQEFAS